MSEYMDFIKRFAKSYARILTGASSHMTIDMVRRGVSIEVTLQLKNAIASALKVG